jgi:phosphoesterase RecJ-like protein
MELSPKQQISELIKQSQKILVVSHKNAGGDAVGSMLALERVLTKEGKEVSLVLSEKIEEATTFLPGIEKIKNDINGARDLVIRLSKDKFPVEKLSYNTEDGFLNIVLTPVNGSLEKNNLEFVNGAFKFDLIFVLDTPDVEKIDAVYDKYTELFFETPIVNVDHHSGNEYFGTVNMVDLTATSTAEILVSIIEAMGPGNFDADVATCLLTGIIADTASFKNVNTTPKSLTISAQMLAAGARQQEIIQNLYKTRPLATLKLWGRVLAGLEYDQIHRMVVSTITAKDFQETGSNIEEIHGVLDELLTSTPGTDIVLLLAETGQGKITGKLKGMNGQDVLAIAEAFGGSGHVLAAGFDMAGTTLEKAKTEVIEKIKQIRDKQLGRVEKNTELVMENTGTSVISELAEIQAPIPVIPNVAEESTDNAPKESPQQDQNDKIVTKTPVASAEELASLDKIVESTDDDFGHEEELAYGEIFTPEAITSSNEDEITQAIKSIDDEIEGVSTPEVIPNIDIEDNVSKKEALQQIGEVIRGYNPGRPIEEKGEQPVDTSVWK